MGIIWWELFHLLALGSRVIRFGLAFAFPFLSFSFFLFPVLFLPLPPFRFLQLSSSVLYPPPSSPSFHRLSYSLQFAAYPSSCFLILFFFLSSLSLSFSIIGLLSLELGVRARTVGKIMVVPAYQVPDLEAHHHQ